MSKEFTLKTYIIQIFNRTESSDSLIASLRHFMFDDQRNPLYIHVFENTIFIYTPHDFWNMNSLSMMTRSHLMGDYFIIYEIDEYDGLLPGVVWEKKQDAKKYYNERETILNKYKRKYVLEKVKRRSFLSDIGDDKPTVEDIDNKVIIEQEKRPKKKIPKETAE